MNSRSTYSSDGHHVKRLDDMDIDWLRVRASGKVPRLGVQCSEIQELIEYTRWLYARRGSLVELCEMLAAAGEIKPRRLERIYQMADWNSEDRTYVAYDRLDPADRPDHRADYWVPHPERCA